MDRIIRAVAADGFIKISAISARDAVERGRVIHNASPVATAALGRSLCAVSMLGDMLKGEDASVTLRINGGGELGSVITVSDSSGNVRGYVTNPEVDLPLRSDGKLDVGGAIGTNGMLTVSRDLGMREPYIGSTALVSGEIAEDLAAYFTESEQVGTACGLGVLVDTDHTVLHAGGFIVQLLPGAPEELIDTLEQNIAAMGPVTSVLTDDDPAVLVEKVLLGLEPEILSDSPMEYRCYCSRERVLDAISSVGIAALREMAEGNEDTSVSCQFCDTVYTFTPDDMHALLHRAEEALQTQTDPGE